MAFSSSSSFALLSLGLLLLALLSALSTNSAVNCQQLSAPKVTSPKLGQLIGESLTVDGRPVSRFLGIPYAKPPLGPLRFARPQPADKVGAVAEGGGGIGGGAFQAKSWPPICVQNTKNPMAGNSAHMGKAKNMSEDCLFLNVWSPAELGKSEGVAAAAADQQLLKPVIVWIHGGGLVIGTSSFDLYDGEMLAAKADAVVVTFNYRVSSLGFLYSDEVAEVKGNQGFWDQNAVLRWVQENIAAFGGRADQVTVMGESAGGWSVSAHILSPVSRGLFQRAILQSGALTSFPMISAPAVHVKRMLTGIRRVGCATPADTTISAAVLQCLRGLPAKKVDELFYKIEQDPFEPLVPVAVVDGQFITERPERMLSTGNYRQNISLLVSTVEDEGSFVVAMYGGAAVPGLKARDPAPYSLAEAEAFLPDLLSKHLFTGAQPGFPQVNVSSEEIKKAYFSGFSPANASQANEWRKRLGVAFGDLAIGCPTLNFARAVFRGAPATATVYQWYFSSKLGKEKFICHPWAGACHCNELYGVFGMPFRYPEHYVEREREISAEVIAFISAFIRTGTPGPQLPEWLPYSMVDGKTLVAPYYEINNEPKKPANFKTNLKAFECNHVWKRFYN